MRLLVLRYSAQALYRACDLIRYRVMSAVTPPRAPHRPSLSLGGGSPPSTLRAPFSAKWLSNPPPNVMSSTVNRLNFPYPAVSALPHPRVELRRNHPPPMFAFDASKHPYVPIPQSLVLQYTASVEPGLFGPRFPHPPPAAYSSKTYQPASEVRCFSRASSGSRVEICGFWRPNFLVTVPARSNILRTIPRCCGLCLAGPVPLSYQTTLPSHPLYPVSRETPPRSAPSLANGPMIVNRPILHFLNSHVREGGILGRGGRWSGGNSCV